MRRPGVVPLEAVMECVRSGESTGDVAENEAIYRNETACPVLEMTWNAVLPGRE